MLLKKIKFQKKVNLAVNYAKRYVPKKKPKKNMDLEKLTIFIQVVKKKSLIFSSKLLFLFIYVWSDILLQNRKSSKSQNKIIGVTESERGKY